MKHKKITALILTACLMVPTTSVFATDSLGGANATNSATEDSSVADVIKGAFTGQNVQKVKNAARDAGFTNAATTPRTPAMGQ